MLQTNTCSSLLQYTEDMALRRVWKTCWVNIYVSIHNMCNGNMNMCIMIINIFSRTLFRNSAQSRVIPWTGMNHHFTKTPFPGSSETFSVYINSFPSHSIHHTQFYIFIMLHVILYVICFVRKWKCTRE